MNNEKCCFFLGCHICKNKSDIESRNENESTPLLTGIKQNKIEGICISNLKMYFYFENQMLF